MGTNLYLNDFRNIFSPLEPKNNFHITGLKLIRDWMYKFGLTSEQAFDAISLGKQRISLEVFESELKRLFNLTSPEIELLFTGIDSNNDGYIHMEEWQEKILEDTNNPLQLLREIVNEHDLNSDDLLFKMNLRIWDEPLDFPKFAKALRILDSSLTDAQLKAIAKSMKNSKNLVEVPALIKNLVGKDYETVDFRDKLYLKIYNFVFGTNDSTLKDKFRNLLIKYDSLNDGTIVSQDLNKVLTEVCPKLSSSEIERFTRFLEKDTRGRIDYTQFIGSLEKVKNYNPFKNLVSRIKAFMNQNNQTVERFMRMLVMSEGGSDYDEPEKHAIEKERKVNIDVFAQFLKSKVDKKNSIEELRKYTQLIDIDGDGYINIHDLESCLGNLNNEVFYKDNGATLVGTFRTVLSERSKFFPKETLSDSKALQVIGKIKEALVAKGISF